MNRQNQCGNEMALIWLVDPQYKNLCHPFGAGRTSVSIRTKGLGSDSAPLNVPDHQLISGIQIHHTEIQQQWFIYPMYRYSNHEQLMNSDFNNQRDK